MENSVEVPQKIKNRTTTWTNISIPEYLLKEEKNANSKILLYLYFHCGIIHNNQDMEAT